MAAAETVVPRVRGPRPKWLVWVIRIAILVAIAAAVVVPVVLIKKTLARKADLKQIRTADATVGNIVQTISASGTIGAQTAASVRIGSQISGRIKHLYVDIGQHVTAGQVVAEIDAPDLEANVAAAEEAGKQNYARYIQQIQGVGMQHTQLLSAFQQATENLRKSQSAHDVAAASLASARSRLKSATSAELGAEARLRNAEAGVRGARAAVPFQNTQTTADIQRAKAALISAQAVLVQTQKSADLQVAAADAALRQAKANAELADRQAKRQEALLAKGFVAGADVDTARTQRNVTAEAVRSAQSQLDITREKVQADLAAAQSGVDEGRAALDAAQSEPYQDVIKQETLRGSEAGMKDAQESVTQARQAVLVAQSDIASALAQLASSEADIRSARAAQASALAGMTQDKLKQQDIKAAYSAYIQNQEQVKTQKAQLDKSFIRTPYSGTVVSLSQQEGETIAAGLSSPTLLQVVDLDRLEVDTMVDETDIGQVKLGQKTSTVVDSYPTRKFTGKVVKISDGATISNNVVTYQVTIFLDPFKSALLKPSMTTDVSIVVTEHDNVVLVPTEAIKRKAVPQRVQKVGKQAAAATIPQVVVFANGRGTVRDIKTGMSDSSNTEVLDGLKPGEKVVVAGFDKLGIEGFSSQATLPGFLKNTSPFGPSSAGKTGGGAKGGK